MDGKSCERCISLVEDIYWSHFQVLHFAQFLRTGFDQHLALPKTFSDNLKEKLPAKVGLRGPGGIVWKIGLTTRDNALYFTHGWKQFVKDHSLKENDLLVFKYNGGESLFDVLTFDGESFCEKVVSYFVRKCEHTENGVGCSSKRKDTDDCVDEVNTLSNAGVECAAPEKSVHNKGVIVPAAIPFEAPSSERTFNAGVESASPEQFMHANGDRVPTSVPSQTTDKRDRNLVSAATHVQAKKRGRPPKVSSARQGVVDTDNCVEEVDTRSNAGLERAALEESVHDDSVIVPAGAPFEAPSSERTTHKRARKLVSAVMLVQTKQRERHPKVYSAHQGVVDTDNCVEDVNTLSSAGGECAALEKSVHHNSVVLVTVPFETPSGEKTSDAVVKSASPQQFIHANGVTVPTADPLQTTDKRFKIRKLVSAVKHVQTKQRGSPPKVSSAGQGVVDWVTDSEVASAGQSAGHIELYASNRRPVTEHEINNAQHFAQAACTKKSLLIVMQPEHVYMRFYLSITSKWIVDHLPPRSQDLILSIGKTKWHVKYCFHRTHYTGVLTGGWRNFALDNNLEEFDVCVFEPTGKVNDTLIIDVNIFRVVEDIAPLSIVKPAGKRGRKRAIRNIQTD